MSRRDDVVVRRGPGQLERQPRRQRFKDDRPELSPGQLPFVRVVEREREVMMLSAFEELSSVEIAGVLEVTESSVRSRLFRARNLLADLLSHPRSIR